MMSKKIKITVFLTLILSFSLLVLQAGAQEKPAEDTAPAGDEYVEEEEGRAAGINYEEEATTLDKADIQGVIKKRYVSIRSCYETQLQTNQKLKGRMVVSFTIMLDGKVKGVKKGNDSTMKDKKVVNCVLDIMKSLQFPERKKGEEIQINYPFNFQAKGN